MSKDELLLVALTALKQMDALVDDMFKSNNLGKMTFQDYELLNTAPGACKRAIIQIERNIR